MSSHSSPLTQSILARLLNLAHESGDDYQWLLQRYVLERFLYRLSRLDPVPPLILKGGFLLGTILSNPFRATRDLDFLMDGELSETELRAVVAKAAALQIDDGLHFSEKTLTISPIRTLVEAGGYRLTLMAHLGQARLKLQIDIGQGDAVYPAPRMLVLPVLLGFPAPSMRAYAVETIISEKTHALIQLGEANSRFKDFFDLDAIATQFEIDGAELLQALTHTFNARAAVSLQDHPVALSPEFALDHVRQQQWKAFLKKSGIKSQLEFPEIIVSLGRFLAPPLKALTKRQEFDFVWTISGGWQPRPGR